MTTFIILGYAMIAGIGAAIFYTLDRRQKKKAAEARAQIKSAQAAKHSETSV